MAQAYRGAIGRTQTATVHVTDTRGGLIAAQVTTSVDAALDPELAERLRAGALNTVSVSGGPAVRIAVPVLYHDPDAELLVLVLDEAQRHRELDERIAVLQQLRADIAAVPAYAKDFAVVFGGEGLRSYLDHHARSRNAASELAAARAELDRLREASPPQSLERAAGVDTDRFTPPSDADAITGPMPRELPEHLDMPDAALELRDVRAARATTQAPDVRAARATTQAPDVRPARAATQAPDVLDAHDAHDATGDIVTHVEAAPAPVPEALPPTLDQLTTKVTELPRKLADASSPDLAPGFHLDRGGVRLVAVAGDQLARELSGALDVRLVLHRLPSYPVIVLVLGAPAALRAPDPAALVVVPLDLASERDRGVLYALGRSFELTVELVTRGRRARRRRLTAPLADNVSYIVGAADDHLRAIAIDGEPDYQQARDRVLGAGFDVLGVEHPEHAEFRDDKLAQTATAQQLRRALAMARRFTRPSREDYLVCTRGYPLVRWHQLRRSALSRAVAWGLWMGPELAQIAIAEGLARSRRELIAQLERSFEHLREDPGAFDLDAEATSDNLTALAMEAQALGVDHRPARGPRAIASDMSSSVSGSIGSAPPRGSARTWPTDALIAQLEGRGPRDEHLPRVEVALALCDRGDPRAARTVVEAALKMSRGEAVRVLARVGKLGVAAQPALLDGLSSSKGYLRQGAALALALLRRDDATQAVIELLLSEPTELWREVARAIGRVGVPALSPLASQVTALGEQATAIHDRVTWAMAHIGARGGSPALATLAAGQSVVAPLATKALALVAQAADDHVREPLVTAPQAERDAAVNHAFSRQFFDAIEAGPTGAPSREPVARAAVDS